MIFTYILRSVLILSITWLSSHHALSQTIGKVEIFQNPKIDSLIAKRVALKTSGLLITNGFRVQIFLGDDREKAYLEQAKFKRMYPKISSYLSYEQPNYKILAGDFITKLEAEKFMNELKPLFTSLFIFSYTINLQ